MRAFSLVELLVAMALFLLALVPLSYSFAQVGRAKVALMAQLSDLDDLENALNGERVPGVEVSPSGAKKGELILGVMR